jgi:hypothetical protein
MAFELLGAHDLAGRGRTMQLMTHGTRLYVGNIDPGVGTSVLDVADPRQPRLVGQLPGYANTWSPKVQVVGDLLYVNYEWRRGEPAERVGVGVFDLAEPSEPREVAFYDTGGRGVHRMWVTEEQPYLYMSAVPEGFRERMLLILDVSDPAAPREVGRWWEPGLCEACGEPPAAPGVKMHHPIVHADRAYVGHWDANLRILDVSDPAAPHLVASARWPAEEGGHTHTAMPLPRRDLLVVTDEAKSVPADDVPRRVRLFDIRDETSPRLLSLLPEPQGEIQTHGPRFGPHNLHEHRPGAFHSDTLVFVTYFGGGLRAYDIRDAQEPIEVAAFVPDPAKGGSWAQTNDVYVQPDGLVFISDRGGLGVHVLAYEP